MFQECLSQLCIGTMWCACCTMLCFGENPLTEEEHKEKTGWFLWSKRQNHDAKNPQCHIEPDKSLYEKMYTSFQYEEPKSYPNDNPNTPFNWWNPHPDSSAMNVESI